MAQHTINLPCIADTYLDGENEFTNYGSAINLLVGYKRASQSLYYDKFAVLKFNYALLPSNKKIIQAKLRYYVTSKVTDQGARLRFHFVGSEFGELSENTVTYSTYESYDYGNDTYKEIEGISASQYNEVQLLLPIRSVCEVQLSPYGSGTYFPYINIASKETANPPILVVTYEDVPPSKPTLKEPIGSFEVNTEVIRLSWNYISSVGGTQKGFNLQWSTDQSTWTTVSQTTANNYYDAPADTFSAGNIYWRVQTINEYDETSEYSEIAAFYAIGAPETPIIQSVTNSAKPTIAWASSNQQVYQLQILQGETVLHDSGIIPGMQSQSYKAPIYLANGDYTVKVRIKNEYDMFSEWATSYFTVNVVQPEKPTLSAQKTIYGIELHVIKNSDKALIYRDGVCIASITGDMYTDYSAASGAEYEYFARVVNESDAFSDSDPVFIKAELKNNLFAPASDFSKIIRLRFNKNTIPGKTLSLNPTSTTTYYSGRTHGVTEFSEHETSAITFAFFVRDYETVKRFKELIKLKETVLFRDARGRKVYGTLSAWNEVDDRSGYQISFVLSETDYNEEVV